MSVTCSSRLFRLLLLLLLVVWFQCRIVACLGRVYRVGAAFILNSSALFSSAPCPIMRPHRQTRTQNFMTEISEKGEMTWFDDFETASDKRALVAKVRTATMIARALLCRHLMVCVDARDLA